jgi:ribonucleoside-diphosphate reductase alpha chain
MTQTRQNLKDFIFVSKYSRIVGSKKETWEEAVHRVMTMHRTHLTSYLKLSEEKLEALEPYLKEAEEAYLDQKVLGAQRALQWGGEQLLTKHMRLYNCAGSPADRSDIFGETMWILLAGAGVGYSVQKHHVVKMPKVELETTLEEEVFVIPDSIEGWADAVHALVRSYMEYGFPPVTFDYSKIRPKGSLISGGFKAPGPEPLKKALDHLRDILDNANGRHLRPIEVHDMICIIADAVVSGGVRRSALLALFSADDEEMASCKTGDWFRKAPWRGRANNSAVILPDTDKEVYNKVFVMTKEYGEPGFAFMKNPDYQYNPCFEVGMHPYYDGQSGWSFCNLTEINGDKIRTFPDFYYAGRAAAILGTIQASYTDFGFLTQTTKNIVESDALIGVGITGMAENPDILFDSINQKDVADVVLKVNAEVADILGINKAARTTVIKPSGNSAQMLGTSSGIHPFHSRKYIRNVQINKTEQVADVIQKQAPRMVEQSVWNDNDLIVSFPVDLANIPHDILVKKDLKALEFLKLVKSTQLNWIKQGTRIDHARYDPNLTHNVSNTITVRSNEWFEVREYLWENKDSFAGVSLLSDSGDLDYPQAPFVEVLDERELAEKYGAAAILAGGLNVDGIHAFGDLWTAIDTALGRGESLEISREDLLEIIDKGTDPYMVGFEYKVGGLKLTDVNSIIVHLWNVLEKKKEWVARFERFASKYLGSDLEKTGHCLKHTSIFHKWNQLNMSPLINWNAVNWEKQLKDAGSEVATACAGGKCEI